MKQTPAFSVVHFQPIGDSRGDLISLESLKNIPFDFKRIYYLFNVPPDTARGFHAHKCLRQVLICVNGSCTVKIDDGDSIAETVLDSPSKGLIIEPGVWREMSSFSPNSVLIVLASEHYDESDYIRDYEVFRQYHRNKTLAHE